MDGRRLQCCSPSCEGVIGYEGKEHTIKAGENFAFAKNGAHWVRAEKPFKMALLLTLD